MTTYWDIGRDRKGLVKAEPCLKGGLGLVWVSAKAGKSGGPHCPDPWNGGGMHLGTGLGSSLK